MYCGNLTSLITNSFFVCFFNRNRALILRSASTSTPTRRRPTSRTRSASCTAAVGRTPPTRCARCARRCSRRDAATASAWGTSASSSRTASRTTATGRSRRRWTRASPASSWSPSASAARWGGVAVRWSLRLSTQLKDRCIKPRVPTGSRKFLNLIISFEYPWMFLNFYWMFLNYFVVRELFSSEKKQRFLLVGYHRWRYGSCAKVVFWWNNVLENMQNPPQKIRYWMFLNFDSCFLYEP